MADNNETTQEDGGVGAFNQRGNEYFDGVARDMFGSDMNRHHLIGFNFLLEHQVKEVIAQYGTLGTLLNDVRYEIKIENVRICADEITPQQAHDFGQNYTCSVLGDIVASTPDAPSTIVYRLSTTIARLPLMTGRTMLHSPLDDEPYPIVGAFIVRGKLRTIPMTKSVIFDVPLIMIKKGEAYLQVRSRHPLKSFRSTSTIDIKVQANKKKSSSGGIHVRMAFQQSHIHIAVLAMSLGCEPEAFVKLIRAVSGSAYKSKVFCKFELSMLCNKWSARMGTSVEKAELCISRLYGKTVSTTGRTIVSSETLSHITFPDNPEKERGAKVFFLASCVSILILVTNKMVANVDIPLRDCFNQSQITSTAGHLGSLFRLLFIAHVRTCGKLLRRALMKLPAPKATKLARLDVLKVFGEHRLSGRIMSSVASGVWSVLRKGVSLALNNNNDDSIEMQLRRISSSLTTTDGTHTIPRNVQTDQFGFICASYTPDGEPVGLVNEMAKTATVSPPTKDRPVLNQLLLIEMADIILSTVEFTNALGSSSSSGETPTNHVLYLDCTNMFAGVIVDLDEFIRRFRVLRRTLAISPYSFINYNKSFNTLQVQFDGGFLCRPLIVAKTAHLVTAKTSFNEALRKGYLEYVNVREQATLCAIAMSPRNCTSVTTHVEITQASLLGVMCGSSVFTTAQQGPRSSYFGGQSKQAITPGIKQRRGAIATTELWSAHKSLVSSKSNDMMPERTALRATPLIIAFLALPGTEEDAVIFSKSSAERNAMMASTTRTYSSEAAPPNPLFSEVFEKPGLVIAKKNVSYAGIEENGMPKCGTAIEGAGVVIGKTRSVKRNIGGTSGLQQGKAEKLMLARFSIGRRDISSTSRRDESGQVVHSSTSTLPTGTRATVTVQTSRPLVCGDKIASRFAQKSTISRFWAQEDMPYSMETGMSPDVIASPLCLTSRMTMGSMLEAITGKAVAITGDMSLGIDEEQFDISNRLHVEKIGKVLKANGFAANGKEKFIDGRSGEMIEGLVFTGVVGRLCYSVVFIGLWCGLLLF
jgi:DNA-directed RNA polymerase subunit B